MPPVMPGDKTITPEKYKPDVQNNLQGRSRERYSLLLHFQRDSDSENILYLRIYPAACCQLGFFFELS